MNIGDKISEISREANDKLREMIDKIREETGEDSEFGKRLGDLKDKTADVFEDLKEQATKLTDQVKEKVDAMTDEAKDKIDAARDKGEAKDADKADHADKAEPVDQPEPTQDAPYGFEDAAEKAQAKPDDQTDAEVTE